VKQAKLTVLTETKFLRTWCLGAIWNKSWRAVVKHIGGQIWELRPLKNRIFLFYWKDNMFVMLHHFIKKTNKTPANEIEIAKSRMKDHIERSGE